MADDLFPRKTDLNLGRQYTIHMFTMSGTLTAPQQALLSLLQMRCENGNVPPTCREICESFGYRSPKAAWDLISALERKGYLTRSRKRARGLHLTSKAAGIPLLGMIAAGNPFEVQTESTERLPLNVASFGIRDRSRAFALRVKGDSMIGRQIFDGDVVLLEQGIIPQHEDIVAALIDNESTLKTLIRQDGKIWLRAENPLFPDLIPAWDLQLQGVARAVLRLLRK